MKKKSSFTWRHLRETLSKWRVVTYPNPTVSLSTHHHSNWNQYAMGVRCFLHTGHKHGAHCQLCSTPSMHSCRWKWFVNIFELHTQLCTKAETQKSNREHRLWDSTSRKWRWACGLYVCSLLIYSVSQTWMIPEGNQELQMFTLGHWSLPAARVHAVTELLLQSYTVMLQCVTTSWHKVSSYPFVKTFKHLSLQRSREPTANTDHDASAVSDLYEHLLFSWDLMLFWTLSRERADSGTWGRAATHCCFWPSISHISPLCENSSFSSKNLKKPHFNKKQSKIFIIKDPKTLRVLTSTNWTFFVQDLRFLNEKHCVDELWRQGPELWILERSYRSRTVSV